MRDFCITVDILAPTERVWEVMADIERWHEWTPSISEVIREDDHPLVVGSRVVIRQPGFPPARWVVKDMVPGTRFSWVSTAPGLHVSGHHSVESTPAGSRATLRLEIRGLFGAIWGVMTKRITERYLGLEANGLKARSENPSFKV